MYPVSKCFKYLHHTDNGKTDMQPACKDHNNKSFVFLFWLLLFLGAVFALINDPNVCQEMVRDLVLDLPLLSSPIILLCLNKELRNQCMQLLKRNSSSHYRKGQEKSSRDRTRTSAETEMVFV